MLAVEGAKYNIKANAIAPVAKTRMTEDLLGPLGDKLEPRYRRPVVTYLSHESCEPTGRVFSVGRRAGRRDLHRRGPRLHQSTNCRPSDRRQLGRRHESVTSYDVPAQMGEEIGIYLRHLA